MRSDSVYYPKASLTDFSQDSILANRITFRGQFQRHNRRFKTSLSVFLLDINGLKFPTRKIDLAPEGVMFLVAALRCDRVKILTQFDSTTGTKCIVHPG